MWDLPITRRSNDLHFLDVPKQRNIVTYKVDINRDYWDGGGRKWELKNQKEMRVLIPTEGNNCREGGIDG